MPEWGGWSRGTPGIEEDVGREHGGNNALGKPAYEAKQCTTFRKETTIDTFEGDQNRFLLTEKGRGPDRASDAKARWRWTQLGPMNNWPALPTLPEWETWRREKPDPTL